MPDETVPQPETSQPENQETTTTKVPTIIKQHLVRKLVKENGKRIAQDVLDSMEDALKRRIVAACNVHNGGKKTIDLTVAQAAGLIGHIGNESTN